MKSIIENISKEIVAASEGSIAGIVTNIYVDERLTRVRGYKVLDDESDRPLLLPLRRLVGSGDALVVRNLSALGESHAPECPIGAKIYDSCGVAHGVLRDLLFDEECGKVLSLVADGEELSAKNVIGFGSRVVVLRAPAHEHTLFRKRPSEKSAPRTPRKTPLIQVREPLPEEMPAEESASLLSEDADFLFPDYAFLLGRTVQKNITGGGEIIAAENDLVTPDVILRAHRNGKLVELTVNSRK